MGQLEDAIILAGGLGKRMHPYTQIVPKPLLPIGPEMDTPVIQEVINHIKEYGILNIFLSVNYKDYLFRAILKDGEELGINLKYIREDKPLGTAGPLKKLEGKLKKDFLVMNGDLITDLNLTELERFHSENKADLTIVTRELEHKIDFGVLNCEGLKVLDWIEKPSKKYLLSAGIYVINPGSISLIPNNEFYNMDSLAREMMKKGKKVVHYLHKGTWIDIGRQEDFERARKLLEKK